MIDPNLIDGPLAWLVSSAVTMAIATIILLWLQRRPGRVWRHPPLLHLAWLCVLVKPLCPPLMPLPVRWNGPISWNGSVVDNRSPANEPSTTERTVTGPLIAPAQLAADPTTRDAMLNRSGSAQWAGQQAMISPSSARPANESSEIKPSQHASAETRSIAATRFPNQVLNKTNLPTPVAAPIGWGKLALMVWWIVAAVLLLRTVWQVVWFGRRVASFDQAPANVIKLVNDRAAAAGLSRPPSIRVTDDRLPPMVWAAPGGGGGIPSERVLSLRPTLVLPRVLLQQAEPSVLRAVVDHELTHLRRRDHWVRWVEAFVVAVFWCNPLVWVARSQLRRWEEVCCDAAAAGRGSWRAREYASALLGAAERLSGRCGRPRACDQPTHFSLTFRFDSLAERIVMLSHPVPQRLSRQCWIAFAIAASAFWLLSPIGLQAENASDTPDAAQSSPIEQADAATPTTDLLVTGVIANHKNQPIAGARVWVFPGAIDTRDVFCPQWMLNKIQDDGRYYLDTPRVPAGEPDAVTDADGRYQVTVKADTPGKVTVEALARGYKRESGWLSSDTPEPIKLKAGQQKLTHNIALEHSDYFAGTVVDADGEPLAGVSIRCSGPSFLERTSTDNSGSFEVFNVKPRSERYSSSASSNSEETYLIFKHPDYPDFRIYDLREIPVNDRDKIAIRLTNGQTITGRVTDDGQPVSGQRVQVIYRGYPEHTAHTDADGCFEIPGVVELGDLVIHTANFADWRYATKRLTSDQSLQDLQFEMVAGPEASPETVKVLGMKLANMKPGMDKMFGRDVSDSGLLFVDFDEPRTLYMGGMESGDRFPKITAESDNNVEMLLSALVSTFEMDEKLRKGVSRDLIEELRLMTGLFPWNVDKMLTPEQQKELKDVLAKVSQ